MRKDQETYLRGLTRIQLLEHAMEVEANLVRLKRLCKVRAMINEERGGSSVHAANVYLLVADCLKNSERITKEIEKSIDILAK